MTAKRILVVGAETEVGRAAAEALAGADARLALVSATTDADAAFAVQRLARKLGASSQAIDGTNEAAVRVMMRQVAKEMDGIDAVVSCVEGVEAEFVRALGEREMARSGGGVFVDAREVVDVVAAVGRQ